jgi:uncharacterized membrane protein (DUF485 family)
MCRGGGYLDARAAHVADLWGEKTVFNRAERIREHPSYQELVRRRSRYGWFLTAIMLLAYFSYVLLIAFDKEALGRPISDGATTVGIPVGFGLIVLGIALTGLYVRRANREFDALLNTVLVETAE